MTLVLCARDLARRPDRRTAIGYISCSCLVCVCVWVCDEFVASSIVYDPCVLTIARMYSLRTAHLWLARVEQFSPVAHARLVRRSFACVVRRAFL